MNMVIELVLDLVNDESVRGIEPSPNTKTMTKNELAIDQELTLDELSVIYGSQIKAKDIKKILAWERAKQNSDKVKRYEKLWGNLDSTVVPYLVGPCPNPMR